MPQSLIKQEYMTSVEAPLSQQQYSDLEDFSSDLLKAFQLEGDKTEEGQEVKRKPLPNDAPALPPRTLTRKARVSARHSLESKASTLSQDSDYQMDLKPSDTQSMMSLKREDLGEFEKALSSTRTKRISATSERMNPLEINPESMEKMHLPNRSSIIGKFKMLGMALNTKKPAPSRYSNELKSDDETLGSSIRVSEEIPRSESLEDVEKKRKRQTISEFMPMLSLVLPPPPLTQPPLIPDKDFASIETQTDVPECLNCISSKDSSSQSKKIEDDLRLQLAAATLQIDEMRKLKESAESRFEKLLLLAQRKRDL